MKNLDFSIRFAIRTYLNLAVNMHIDISEFFGVYQLVHLVPPVVVAAVQNRLSWGDHLGPNS